MDRKTFILAVCVIFISMSVIVFGFTKMMQNVESLLLHSHYENVGTVTYHEELPVEELRVEKENISSIAGTVFDKDYVGNLNDIEILLVIITGLLLVGIISFWVWGHGVLKDFSEDLYLMKRDLNAIRYKICDAVQDEKEPEDPENPENEN